MDFASFMRELAETRALPMRHEGAVRVCELSVQQGPLVEVRMDSVLTDKPAQLSAELADVPHEAALRARVMGRVLELNHARARRRGAALRPQLAPDASPMKMAPGAHANETILLQKTLTPRRARPSEFLRDLVQFARLAAEARAAIWAVLPRPAGL